LRVSFLTKGVWEKTEMRMPAIGGLLMTAVVVLVIVAAANRIEFLKKIVYPA
jgi:hypothetical protein